MFTENNVYPPLNKTRGGIERGKKDLPLAFRDKSRVKISSPPPPIVFSQRLSVGPPEGVFFHLLQKCFLMVFEYAVSRSYRSFFLLVYMLLLGPAENFFLVY